MRLRDSLKPWVQWKLGDRQQCLAFTQPWFQGALDCIPVGEGQKSLKTCGLLDDQTGTWNLDRLIQEFGYSNCMEILANIAPPVQGAEGDWLVFKKASIGIFSIKKGYKILKGTESVINIGGKVLWESVWHRGKVLPRVKKNLWKLLHKALPLATIMNRHFPSHNPVCATCGGQEEDVSHLLHLCPFSRACYLASLLGLRTDVLHGIFAEVLQAISEQLDDEQWVIYVNSAWAIWRCRNDCAYSGKQSDFNVFLINRETKTGDACKHFALTGRMPSLVSLTEVNNDYSCFSVGSWTEGWLGGIGVVVWYKEEMMLYKSKGVKGFCPLQVEAMALRDSVLTVAGLGIAECSFFTDCLELMNICSSQQPPINTDWRVFDEILEVWSLMQENKSFICVHVQKNQNDMADKLAKQGRINGWDCVRHTLPCFKQ